MTRRVCVSEIEGGNARGRPPVKWKDRVQEYVRERGERSVRSFDQARRECLDGSSWKLFCYAGVDEKNDDVDVSIYIQCNEKINK